MELGNDFTAYPDPFLKHYHQKLVYSKFQAGQSSPYQAAHRKTSRPLPQEKILEWPHFVLLNFRGGSTVLA